MALSVDGAVLLVAARDRTIWPARPPNGRRGEGWFAACEQAGRHLVVTRELADALARLLSALESGPVLEVCAGRGELAAALQQRGIHLVATDAVPPAGSATVRLDAAEAWNVSSHGP